MKRLLLDSHVVIAVSLRRLDTTYPRFARLMADEDVDPHVSAASLWELAIKVRIGKLTLASDLGALVGQLRLGGLSILPVDEHHATAKLRVDPPTRDPFDRMLLVQCQVEGLQLVTADRALAGHPLAWREV